MTLCCDPLSIYEASRYLTRTGRPPRSDSGLCQSHLARVTLPRTTPPRSRNSGAPAHQHWCMGCPPSAAILIPSSAEHQIGPRVRSERPAIRLALVLACGFASSHSVGRFPIRAWLGWLTSAAVRPPGWWQFAIKAGPSVRRQPTQIPHTQLGLSSLLIPTNLLARRHIHAQSPPDTSLSFATMRNTFEATRKVWFITGTSSGFGKRLVSTVLSRGDYVIATVRNLESFTLPVGDRARLRIIVLDVCDSTENIQKTVNEALSIWGRIDVVVNNAGYGLKSLIEEGGALAATKQFQTNVMGVINVTNAILPHMRERRSGTVVMIGSRSAWHATPITGFYVASKAAVHALAETYATELAQFNIRVTVCAPGAFRTENVHNVPYTSNYHIPEYDALREKTTGMFKSIGAQAMGDPDKAMNVLVDAVRGEGKAKGRELPMYLMLGNATYEHVREHYTRLLEDMDKWEDIAKDLDFDPVPN